MKNKNIFFIFLLLFALAMPAFGQYYNIKAQPALWKTDSVYKFETVVRRYDIKFEYGKAILLPQDSVFLDSLADFLHDHSELVIEIGVHGQLGVHGWGNYMTRKK